MSYCFIMVSYYLFLDVVSFGDFFKNSRHFRDTHITDILKSVRPRNTLADNLTLESASYRFLLVIGGSTYL